jgi:hypothetical protein
MTGEEGRATAAVDSKAVALYHDMRVEENFDKCAIRLFEILRRAQKTNPGARRLLYLDVQGHRNDVGGFDHDAYELMTSFIFGFLSPYLSEIHTPLISARNPKRQRNDVPDEIQITDPSDSHMYDHDSLAVRVREFEPDSRVTRPSVRAIADYLGLDEPLCLICWDTPVERAHAVPASLGGSNAPRNFALLCRRHHSESPDVSDAEAFWSWVDYACQRDGHEKYQRFTEHTGTDIVKSAVDTAERSVHHFEIVQEELMKHYNWHSDDFRSSRWGDLMREFHVVMEAATSTHFGIKRKASTEAWAFAVAKRRLDAG